jgi:hypothetical protein
MGSLGLRASQRGALLFAGTQGDLAAQQFFEHLL